MIAISADACEYILEQFEKKNTSSAHSNVWKRRSYAPMYIHTPKLEPLKDLVAKRFPDYTIAFDVVFDSDGREVHWHCDYESLGPFHVPHRLNAVRNHHFLSIHFNLTEKGGNLVMYDGLILSYVYYLCISWFGIFSWMHWILTQVSHPLFILFARKCKSDRLIGNVFDNTRLHSVTAGHPRTSYVLRLVKDDVKLTQSSVSKGIARSSACQVFVPLLPVVQEEEVCVRDIDWRHLF